jgi:hypothetical protein
LFIGSCSSVAGPGPGAALTFRPVGRVAADAVADGAARTLGSREAEAGLVRRPVDDEAHRDALDAAGAVEGHQADVVVREGLAALGELVQHAGAVLKVEHRHAEHLPVGVARVRVVGVLDAPGVASGQAVVDLGADLVVGQVGQEAELALGDAAGGVGHHRCGSGWGGPPRADSLGAWLGEREEGDSWRGLRRPTA